MCRTPLEQFVGCIRLAWECAAACDGLAKALMRDSEDVLEWFGLCTQVCQACVRACKAPTDETVQRCVEGCWQFQPLSLATG